MATPLIVRPCANTDELRAAFAGNGLRDRLVLLERGQRVAV